MGEKLSEKYCTNCGVALSPGARFCSQCGEPVSVAPQMASSQPAGPPEPPVYAPPASPVQPPYGVSASVPQVSYASPASPVPRKKHRGCLWGCLALVVGSIVVVAGVILALALFPPRSNKMTVGPRETLASESIPPAGGAVIVAAPDSPVDGMTITVPEGAYDGSQRFKVFARPIESHALGANFNPITPLIHVDHGGEVAGESLVIEVPIQIEPDEFAMAFYYDPRTGELEGIPVADLTTDKIILVTEHFSDFVITKIPWYVLESVSVDTGFAPGVDDWQFVNEGSYLAPKGHCAGQSVSAMWYYYEQRLKAGPPPLYGRFDDNDYPLSTSSFWADDAWAYRFASVVQTDLIDWDHTSRAFFKEMGATSDTLTWGAFAYAMLATGEPQYVAIYSADGGHAMVVYKMEAGRLYVADPNYPGKTGRFISFENGAFLPYYSGANATAISEEGETAYTSIRYMAKSAMTNWADIGAEYRKMLQGKSGEGRFPDYKLDYLTGVNETTGEKIWSPAPDVLNLTEEDTVKPGESLRGEVVFRLTPLIDLGDVIGSLYEGTERLFYFSSTGADNHVEFTYPLEPGVHHVGFRFDDFVPSPADENRGQINYIDFRRIKVIYEPEDLTGTWEGAWQVRSADKAKRYIQELIVKLLMLFGVDEGKAWEAAEAGVQEDPHLYEDRPMTIIFEPVAPGRHDRYHIQVFMAGALSPAYEGEATYQEGILTFKVRAEDGSMVAYTGSLTDDETLSGVFSITAWLVIKDAVTGDWQIVRQR